MKFQVKNIQKATWNDKSYFKATIVNESGEEFQNIAFWAGEITEETTEIEGELSKNDKGYWKFTAPKSTPNKKPNMDRLMEKKQSQIIESQARKDESIRMAQERSEWLYAKNNASLLIANHPSFQTMDSKHIAEAVISLATKIKNGQPTEPFS